LFGGGVKFGTEAQAATKPTASRKKKLSTRKKRVSDRWGMGGLKPRYQSGMNIQIGNKSDMRGPKSRKKEARNL